MIPLFGSKDGVPVSVAGLTLVDVIQYEDQRLGAEFRYGFPPICKADAYLYDLGLTEIPDDLQAPMVAEAFRQSYEGVLQAAKLGVTRDLEVLGRSILTVPGEPSTPFCYHASFAYRQNAHGPHRPEGITTLSNSDNYVVSDIGRMRSHLAVRSDRGCINKVRFTYVERATDPPYLGIDPDELPEHLRDDVAFAGFWNFLMAWTRAVQSAPTQTPSQSAGGPSTSASHSVPPSPASASFAGSSGKPGSAASVTQTTSAAGCQACHRSPAAPLKLVQQTGLVFTRRSATMNANLCQSCGRALFRQTQAHNLAFGWWGIVSFFSNFLTLGGNFTRSLKHRAIGPPAGLPLAAGLDPGRPVWLRVQTIVPVALTALAVFGIISSMSHERVGALHPGQCIDVPPSGSFADVALVPCDQPHDAEVAGVLPANTSASIDTQKACVELAAERVLLSKARSVSPGTLEPTARPESTSSNSGTPRAICILAGVDGAKLTGRVTGGN